jgi:hypothetical protein
MCYEIHCYKENYDILYIYKTLLSRYKGKHILQAWRKAIFCVSSFIHLFIHWFIHAVAFLTTGQ